MNMDTGRWHRELARQMFIHRDKPLDQMMRDAEEIIRLHPSIEPVRLGLPSRRDFFSRIRKARTNEISFRSSPAC